MLRNIVCLAFLIHGLGMGGGIYLIYARKGWLQNSIGGGAITNAIVSAVWVISGAAFIGAAWFLFQNSVQWTTWAWVAAPTSVIGIALAAGTIPPGTYAGGAMALITIIYLIFFN